jgi:hypothetical protein
VIEEATLAQAREWALAHPRTALALVLELLGSLYEHTRDGTTYGDALFWSITWAGVAHASHELEEASS